MDVLAHVCIFTPLWYMYAAAILAGSCFVFRTPITAELAAYLLFQDLWFYMYHRAGHYCFARLWVPSLFKLHLIHHNAGAQPEWLAYFVNYLPLELMGCALYAQVYPVDRFVLVTICLLLSATVHLCIHRIAHSSKFVTDLPLLWRLRKYHSHHHRPYAHMKSFSACSPLGDLLFGTMHISTTHRTGRS